MGAQDVGHSPDNSPYRDIETPQRFSVFVGYLAASKDKIGAIPHSAPMFGARYEVAVGGPAQFFARIAYAPSKRNAYDPTALAANRDLGEVSIPLYFTDLGFSFNLTGKKSWNNIIPTAGFGIGIVSGTKNTELDPYRFGTKFTISTDIGVKYLAKNDWEFRTNIGNMIYQTKYPTPYFNAGVAGSPLVTSGKRSSYRNNWVLTVGGSVPIFR